MFRGGVLWAELAASPQLASLAGDLMRELRTVMELPDGDRPFRAHLTLARAPRGVRIKRDLAGATVPPAAWSLRRVVLMESKLGRGGSTYTVDTAWPLD
jgi:2'-5' RNA ligase